MFEKIKEKRAQKRADKEILRKAMERAKQQELENKSWYQEQQRIKNGITIKDENITKVEEVIESSLSSPMFLKIVGTSFNNEDGTNRQTIIKKIIKNFKDPVKYDGMTNADMKATEEPDLIYYQYSGNRFPLDLKQYDYKGKPAFFVVSEYGIIGNVPKDNINDIMSIYEKYNDVEISGEIIGGKYKKTQYKDTDDWNDFSVEVITGEFDDYGIEMRIMFK